MTVPNWYHLAILALAAYRTWRLLAEDDILDKPRRRLVRLGESWKKDGDPLPDGYRSTLALFLNCPWCAGGWVSVGWWIFWQLSEHWAAVVAVPFAISALVGFARSRLDPPE